MNDIEQKLEKLKQIIKDMQSVLIAYSGGVFSTLLVSVAKEVLPINKVIAITVKSEIHSLRTLKMACANASQLHVKHLSLRTTVLNQEKFLRNDELKCYYCKRLLFSRLKQIAQEQELNYVIDGISVENLQNSHMGIKASQELEIRHPLAEAGLTENEIRKIAKQRNLNNWNEPAPECLASRVPQGFYITPDTLKRIEEAEEILKELGFNIPQVQAHNDLARIILTPKDTTKIFKKGNPALITETFKKIGFNYTTIDILGIQSEDNKSNTIINNEKG